MKKLISIILAITFMACCFVGCDGTDNDPTSGITDPPTTNEDTAETTTETLKNSEKTPLEIATNMAAKLGGTDVMEMAAEIIGADSGASFKIGDNKYELYLFSDSDKIAQAKTGTFTFDAGFGEMTVNAVVKGNIALMSSSNIGTEVITAFNAE